jgi:hypothetical protein
MKNGVFWDVTPCGPCNNRRFGGTSRLLHQGDKNRCVRRFQITASVVPSSPILVTLMKGALSSSERRFLQEPHGVTSQKKAFFIVTAV